MYLFSSIRYKIGTTEIETINCPGQTTSMLAYLTLPDDFSTSSGLKSCWTKDTTENAVSVEYTTINVTAIIKLPQLIHLYPLEIGDIIKVLL